MCAALGCGDTIHQRAGAGWGVAALQRLAAGHICGARRCSAPLQCWGRRQRPPPLQTLWVPTLDPTSRNQPRNQSLAMMVVVVAVDVATRGHGGPGEG